MGLSRLEICTFTHFFLVSLRALLTLFRTSELDKVLIPTAPDIPMYVNLIFSSILVLEFKLQFVIAYTYITHKT